MEEIKTQLEEKNSILSAEQKRQISNKLVFIQLSADKMAAEKAEIYKLVKEIKDILDEA
jgi:hypothetical protein